MRLPIEDDFHALASDQFFMPALVSRVESEATRCASLEAALRRLSDPATWPDSASIEEREALQRLQAPALQTATALSEACAELRELGELSQRTQRVPADKLAVACNGPVRAIASFAEVLTTQRSELTPQDRLGSPRTGISVHERLVTLARDLALADIKITELKGVAEQPAVRAGQSAALLVVGEAGQGKTHLFLDAAAQALSNGGLALCVLGEQLSRGDLLTQIAVLCGLGSLSHDVFLGALNAAGATAGSRLLLLIDAINESESPETWVSTLPSLIAQIRTYPHIAVALSCRTVFVPHILPADQELARLNVPVRRHEGFSGFELEALETYLSEAAQYIPRAPLLRPDFSSPLFVKLYAQVAEGYQDAAASPASHRSELFGRFLTQRTARATRRLRLDPEERRVEQAVELVARELARSGGNALPRAQAVALVNAFAPDRTQWPDTMFGVLRSEGVLADDRLLTIDGQVVPGVGFPYQVLGDLRICQQVLDDHAAELSALRNGVMLAPDGPLADWLGHAPANLLEAVTLLLPERAGVELIDALDLKDSKRRRALLLLSTSLAMRRPDAITPRTMELVGEAQRQGWDHEVWEAIFAVTAEPGHKLNADWLHRRLLSTPRAERDAWWIPRTFYAANEDDDALQRLLRWAEQMPTPQRLRPDATGPLGTARPAAPDEVIRLGATTLTWLLASSNRFVRDRATKALVQLLLGYPRITATLIDRFCCEDRARIDDPYITQRLWMVAYGIVLRSGHAEPGLVSDLAGKAVSLVLDPAPELEVVPDVLSRDAAAGIAEYAAAHELLDKTALKRARPPYRSASLTEPATWADLEMQYPKLGQKGSGSYSALYFSLNSHGDFAKYRVAPNLHEISYAPLRSPLTGASGGGEEPTRANLPASQDTAGAPAREEEADVAPASAVERQLPLPGWNENARGGGGRDEWVYRWIFERVVGLGWTPELFHSFEAGIRDHDPGRGAHKPERIGKKYQWIAWHELAARLTDHYQLTRDWTGDARAYEGAWQFRVRDIDPSLPPSPHPRTHHAWLISDLREQDRSAQTATFPSDGPKVFWVPPSPNLPSTDAEEAWLQNEKDLPGLPERLITTDPTGQRWISLAQYATHTRRTEAADAYESDRCHQWHHIDSWLVRVSQTAELAAYLEGHSLMGKWMPNGDNHTAVYLGEAPWSRAWRASDATSRFAPLEASSFDTDDPDVGIGEWTDRTIADATGVAITLAPAVRPYTWSSGEADCSLESDAHALTPATLLLEGAGLVRHPDRADWYHGSKLVISSRVQRSESPAITALLVREDWLLDRLDTLGFGLVSALLAERMLIQRQPTSWRSIDHVGHLAGRRWSFGSVRTKLEESES